MRDVMKAITMLFAVVVATACAHGGRPETGAPAGAQAAEGEAQLAAALGGRIAGPAQDCVSERDLGANESYGGRAILFRGPTDDVVYVNRPSARCPGLGFGGALRVRTPAARLCRGDMVTVFEPVSGTELGGCSLGQFTPYRRAVPVTIK
jgi:hypothetical protein